MLDPSVYLASFGWKGKGNGLQHGSASRPLAIPQKRTLAGLGKDRDEAFPFWDDLFAAAAKSIQIKLSGFEVETNIDPAPQPVFLRTKTGILSNRRPITGTPATSGTATPSSSSDAQNSSGRASIMAIARRENARKCLYARFFKGPILGPDIDASMTMTIDVKQAIEGVQDILPQLGPGSSTLEQQIQPKRKKKRKHSVGAIADEMEKGKRRRRDRNCGIALDEGSRKMEITQSAQNEEQYKPNAGEEDRIIAQLVEEEKHTTKAAKSERRKIKEERRKRKQERRIARVAGNSL